MPEDSDKPELNRRGFLKAALGLGVSAAALTGEKKIKKLDDSIKGLTKAAQPTPIPETPTPTPQQEPEPTSQTEKEQSNEITIAGYIENDKIDPSFEKIRFQFPEKLLDGKTPLIPKGDKLNFFFVLESTSPINQLKLSIPELLDIKNVHLISLPDATQGSARLNVSNIVDQTTKVAEANGNPLNFDSDSKNIIKQIEIMHSQLEEGKLVMRLIFPNMDIAYTDNNGSHLVNPARRFAEGNFVLGIKRREVSDGSVVAGPGGKLIAKAVDISNGKGEQAAKSKDIIFTGPKKITVISSAEQPTEPLSGKTPSEKIESKWTREYKPDETVNLSKWLDDMIDKGYIQISSSAQKIAGDKINAYRDANLVPNPVNYRNKQLAFMGNCESKLRELEADYGNNFMISQEAYSQIPGGVDCQIFSKGD